MSTGPLGEAPQEVRVSEYVRRAARRWYVIVLSVVVTVLVVILSSLANGRQFEASTTVYLGLPLTPGGNAPLTGGAISASEAVATAKSDRAMRDAAAAAKLSTGQLRGHVSATAVLSGTGTTPGARAAAQASLVQITVDGPFGDRKVAAAADSLARSLQRVANGYAARKIARFESQVKSENQQIATFRATIDTAQRSLARLRSAPPTPTTATEVGILLSTLTNANTNLTTVTNSLHETQLLLDTARTVEAARVVSPAAARTVSARSRKSSLVIAALVGLVVGTALALAWDALRTRPRRPVRAS
jgi:uncharacterized protein involved in exopolysaccharide biosynthesis